MSLPPGSPPMPVSPRKLLLAALAAFLSAAIILAAFVLPAEYGIDPLGTGKATGLLALQPSATNFPAAPASKSDLPRRQGPATLYAAAYKLDSREIVLQPYDFVEYKYYLVKGAGMSFAWKASAPVNQEFHGEEDAENSTTQSYEKDTRSEGSGSLVAPFNGIHGWYWENPGNRPITVRIDSAGFYKYSVEIHSNGLRQRHDVRSITDLAPAKG